MPTLKYIYSCTHMNNVSIQTLHESYVLQKERL